VKAPLTVAVAQPPCRAGDIEANARAHAAAVRGARARLVVFPELSLTGYDLAAEPVDPAGAALRPVVDACAATGAVALAGAPVEEAGRRYIAALRIDAGGATVAYRKSHLGGEETRRFSPGDGATAITVDGWRIGLGICKDTGVAEHAAATAALDVDVYAAGLVHLPEELGEQDARGRRIAAACGSYVAFASFAGPTLGPYAATAGESAIWSPDGALVARASARPGDVARARLEPSRMPDGSRGTIAGRRKEGLMPAPEDRPATLTDDEIETRPMGAVYANADDGDDTGDDTGDPTDTSDTGDDSGDDSGPAA
jgi:predicted amidohydrolase